MLKCDSSLALTVIMNALFDAKMDEGYGFVTDKNFRAIGKDGSQLAGRASFGMNGEDFYIIEDGMKPMEAYPATVRYNSADNGGVPLTECERLAVLAAGRFLDGKALEQVPAKAGWQELYYGQDPRPAALDILKSVLSGGDSRNLRDQLVLDIVKALKDKGWKEEEFEN